MVQLTLLVKWSWLAQPPLTKNEDGVSQSQAQQVDGHLATIVVRMPAGIQCSCIYLLGTD